jgi:hypothetical protein
MEPLSLIELLNGVFWIAGFFILIYLIFRRVEDKKREDFENRDN